MGEHTFTPMSGPMYACLYPRMGRVCECVRAHAYVVRALHAPGPTRELYPGDIPPVRVRLWGGGSAIYCDDASHGGRRYTPSVPILLKIKDLRESQYVRRLRKSEK